MIIYGRSAHTPFCSIVQAVALRHVSPMLVGLVVIIVHYFIAGNWLSPQDVFPSLILLVYVQQPLVIACVYATNK